MTTDRLTTVELIGCASRRFPLAASHTAGTEHIGGQRCSARMAAGTAGDHRRPSLHTALPVPALVARPLTPDDGRSAERQFWCGASGRGVCLTNGRITGRPRLHCAASVAEIRRRAAGRRDDVTHPEPTSARRVLLAAQRPTVPKVPVK